MRHTGAIQLGHALRRNRLLRLPSRHFKVGVAAGYLLGHRNPQGIGPLDARGR